MNDRSVLFLQYEKDWLARLNPGIFPAYQMTSFHFSAESKSIEKLKIILEIADNEFIWSELDVVDKFPKWFVEQFSPEMPNEEAALLMEKWRSLDEDGRNAAREKSRWSFGGWIYWLHPDNRMWYVIGEQKYPDGRYSLTLLAEEWPAPVDAFLWLLRSVGATNVEAA